MESGYPGKSWKVKRNSFNVVPGCGMVVFAGHHWKGLPLSEGKVRGVSHGGARRGKEKVVIGGGKLLATTG